MSFRATNKTPSNAYREIKLEASRLKEFANRTSTALNSSFSAQSLSGVVAILNQHKNKLNNLKTTDGLQQYAKDQETDQAYDVAAEFIALIATIDNAINEIQTIPTNTLIASWGDSGVIWNTFTSLQGADLKAKLDLIDNAVS